MKNSLLLTAIVIAAGFLIVCGVLLFEYSTKSTTMHTAPARPEKGNGILQQKENSLLEQLKKVKLDERSFAEENEPDEDGMEVITKEEMRADAERWKRIRPIYYSQSLVVLKQIMMEEKINEDWTEEVRKEALEIVGKPEFDGTNMLDVECHESLCRLRLLHDDLSSFEHFKELGLRFGPWNTDQVGTKKDLEGGTIETTMFFSDRDGNPEPFNVMMDRLDEIATSMPKGE